MTFTAIAPAGFTAHARSPHLEVAGQPDQFAVPDACGEIRVLIADGQALVRAGLRSLLEAGGSIDVVGEAATGDEALAMAPLSRPDVVLIDAPLPGLDCIEATRVMSAESGVILITASEADERMVVSPATAKTRVSRAMIKLNARDRAAVVIFAYEAALVGPHVGAASRRKTGHCRVPTIASAVRPVCGPPRTTHAGTAAAPVAGEGAGGRTTTAARSRTTLRSPVSPNSEERS
jgi:CheY-like chemotaxis protein